MSGTPHRKLQKWLAVGGSQQAVQAVMNQDAQRVHRHAHQQHTGRQCRPTRVRPTRQPRAREIDRDERRDLGHAPGV